VREFAIVYCEKLIHDIPFALKYRTFALSS
jgi:hypothetical protein